MTDYPAILREMILAGYEGAALLAAFERLCAAIGGAGAAAGNGARTSAPSAPRQARQKVSSAPAQPRPEPVDHKPPKFAKALGRKALGAMGLSGRAVAVGSQLLEHFNATTRRCDPGIDSLVKSTRMPRRGVQRALDELQSAGAFAVVKNGGQRHANRYLPNWPRLVEIAAGVSASAPDLTAGGDKSVTQNLGKKPDSIPVVVKAQGSRRGAGVQQDRRQRELALMRPLDGGKASARQTYSEIADTEARNRLREQMSAWLRDRYPDDKAAFATGIQRAWEMDVAAVLAAEITRKGSGLAVWLRLLGWSEDRAAG